MHPGLRGGCRSGSKCLPQPLQTEGRKYRYSVILALIKLFLCRYLEMLFFHSIPSEKWETLCLAYFRGQYSYFISFVNATKTRLPANWGTCKSRTRSCTGKLLSLRASVFQRTCWLTKALGRSHPCGQLLCFC
jgi:hypothetical protein